jgi:hypothetical protein
MDNWWATGDLASHHPANQHQADLRREAEMNRLARLARGDGAIGDHLSMLDRLRATVRARVRRDHSLTDYPCRLPDGGTGRVAVVLLEGEWTVVCRAPQAGFVARR